jgi:hypothetical protein
VKSKPPEHVRELILPNNVHTEELEKNWESVHKHMEIRTVTNIGGLNDFEFFLDIRIEKAVEIEPIWTLLPTGEIRNFISVDDIAFST